MVRSISKILAFFECKNSGDDLVFLGQASICIKNDCHKKDKKKEYFMEEINHL